MSPKNISEYPTLFDAEGRATVAAVDLGSNSFHLIVATLDQTGHLQVVDKLRETVRLAAGLTPDKQLSAEAKENAINCLKRFGQRLKTLPQGAVQAVGTNTLRQVRQADAFLAEARAALGHPIEIIAGREEARLVYLGVAHGLAAGEGRRLVVDIGGGSTELIVGEGFSPLKRESLHMGCVSMSLAHFPDGLITVSAMRNAETAAALELRPVKGAFLSTDWVSAVGSSGTIKAIRDVVAAAGWCDQGISHSALKKLKKALVAAGQVDKLSFPVLSSDRLPVIAGGVAVLVSVFKALKIKQMMVSNQALREGLLYDMIGRIHHQDVRDATVSALIKRYDLDVEQAQRVQTTALALLEQTQGVWEIGIDEGELMLGWACRLHEIGVRISHSQYQKHGSYIVKNADMPGFTRHQQQLLAALVLGHRRKLTPAIFEALPEVERASALYLCVLLRLGVLLHRSRSAVNRPFPTLTIEGDALSLHFPNKWLKSHPLTCAELEQEAKRLKPVGFKLCYE